jgi:AraC-like DNA-binding protein
MVEKALKHYYFLDKECPINLKRVARRHEITHAHDLTEVEHFHDFTELVFITNGQGVQVLEGNEYQVSAGDVFVLQGYQRHFFKDARTVEIINIMFAEDTHSELIPPSVKQMEGYKALFILEPQLRSNSKYRNMLRLTREELAPLELVINTMFAELQQKRDGYEMILINRFVELVILLSRYVVGNTNTKTSALLRIGKAIEHLENNYSDDIYTDGLSQLSCMSKRNFMRIFHDAVGMSPNNYLRQIRLQKARAMLRESNRQISEISSLCGFNDSSFFIKCFKGAYEITPNMFRARYKS